MNFALHEMERIQWTLDAATPYTHVDWYDWIITRPSKNGKKRVTVGILNGLTKREFAEWWIKHRQPSWKAKVFFNPQKPIKGV